MNKTKLYLDEETFVTADPSGMLEIECGEVFIRFDKEQSEKIIRFLNYAYGPFEIAKGLKADKLDQR